MTRPTGGWERISAHEGGTVSGLATATTGDGSVRVFAATAVGIFWSQDGGATWRPLDAGGAVAGAEVVAPSPDYARDGTVFAGGHDGLFRWQVARPGWVHLLQGSRVLTLAVLSGVPDDERAGAAAYPTLLAGTEEDGILISRDGGRTWEGANPGLLDLTVLAITASPAFHDDGLAFAATPSGLYRTRNGAESWRALDLDDDDIAVQCLALSPDFVDDRVILAGTEEHGLLRSEDGGRTWDSAPELADRSVNAVQIGGGGRAVAATDTGLARSDDGGVSWRLVGREHDGVICAVLVAQGAAHTLLAGLPDRGVARSLDDGATWAAANDGLTAALLTGLACSPTFVQDQTLYASGLERGVSVSCDGGRTWTEANNGLDDLTVSRLVAVPTLDGGSALFAATDSGLYVSRDSAQTWETAFRLPDDTPVQVLAAISGTVVVAASGGLVLSPDGGRSWTPREAPGGARVVALALSPSFERDGTLYTATLGVPRGDGTADLTVWQSRGHGARWERLLEERAVGGVHLACIRGEASAPTLLVGIGGRLLRPRAHAVEVRGGERRPVWDTTTLPAALSDLVTGPGHKVIAATGAGVFASDDGGETFAAWSDGLGTAGVVALLVPPVAGGDRPVFALGLGGTIWRRSR